MRKNLQSRREFLKAAAMSIAVTGLSGCPEDLQSFRGKGEKPNIVICLVDDMGYAHIESNYHNFKAEELNQDLIKRDLSKTPEGPSQKNKYTLDQALTATVKSMPYLKKLISEGARMTDAHVANSLCAPSRAGILTGRYPQTYGIYNNTDMNRFGVPKEVKMMPELFQENGYDTACFGKWHVAAYAGSKDGSCRYPDQHPNNKGFNYYMGFNSSGTPYYNSDILYKNDKRIKAKGYLTDQITNETVDFIKKTEKPFMAYIAYNCPHGPLTKLAPEQYDKPFSHLPRIIRIWNSYMYAVDCGIKKIFETINAKGHLGNTMFFFLSDNGASGGTPLPTNGFNRGYKGTLYSGGTRTGMMAWGPKWVKKKQVLSTMISSMDIFPTALEAAGIDISPSLKLDGKSFLSLLSKKSQKPIHDCLVWANRNSLSWSYRAPGTSKTRNVPAAWTIKKGKWMLHYFSGQGKYELYNYAKDLGEKNDLHEKYPEVVKELKKDYASWFASVKKPLYWNLETWYGLIPDEQRTPEQNKAMKSKLAEYAAKVAKQKN